MWLLSVYLPSIIQCGCAPFKYILKTYIIPDKFNFSKNVEECSELIVPPADDGNGKFAANNPCSRDLLELKLDGPIYQSESFFKTSGWLLLMWTLAVLFFGFPWTAKGLLFTFVLWLCILKCLIDGRFNRSNYLRKEDMHGKTVVLTGGTSGIGKITVELLLSYGARVIMGSRDVKKANKIKEDMYKRNSKLCDDSNLVVKELNLEDVKSIKRFADRLKNEDIHILINSAGSVFWKVMGTVYIEGMEASFFVNYFSHFMLSYLLFNNLKRCGGKVLNVTSFGHVFNDLNKGFEMDAVLEPQQKHPATEWNEKAHIFSCIGYYAKSKLAQIWHARELHRRLSAKSKASAYAVHPGGCQTNLLTPRVPLKACDNISPDFNPLVYLGMGYRYFYSSIIRSTYTIIYLCLARPKELQGGGYYRLCSLGKTIPATNNNHQAKRLWEWSERRVKELIDQKF